MSEVRRIDRIVESPALMRMLGIPRVEALADLGVRSVFALAMLPSQSLAPLGPEAVEAKRHARWQIEAGIAVGVR
jgi:hypothetical protein